MAHKVLESGIYWPSIFRIHITFANHVKNAKRIGNITHKNQMPLTNILVS